LYDTQVVYKSVHQFFSADTYLSTGKMNFTSDGAINSDFMTPSYAG